MTRRLLVFGGTSEARTLLERGVPQTDSGSPSVLCCVATDYGAKLLEGLKNLSVLVGRLDAPAMQDLFRREGVTNVIDATHPYAAEATRNIKAACRETGVTYLRVAREPTPPMGHVTVVQSARAAAGLLNESDEKALLTVGSRELAAFAGIKGARERLFARVLPVSSVIAHCEALGFDAGHIIAMQGPFSVEMNELLLAATGTETIVTKDGGAAGGTEEKLRAAAKRNARVIMIARPDEDGGVSLEEALLTMRRVMGFPALPLFPMLLPAEGRRALIIGGGSVALRRAKTLARCGADIAAVAPRFCGGWDAVQAKRISRPWAIGDLDGAFLAVAATDCREENSRIAAEAKRRHVPVSVADCAAEGTFYFPALVECDGAAASVSTGGIDPTLTHELANRLREVWPEIVAQAKDARHLDGHEDGGR